LSRRQPTSAETLIIDRDAAAENPSPEDVREWARDKRVFISSVIAELRSERETAGAAIQSAGARPVMFGRFGGRDADPENACLSVFETSDIYVGILGRKYRRPLPSRFSAAHTEHLHAT
jgi:hypothetical protein